jgi:hypothetical protein
MFYEMGWSFFFLQEMGWSLCAYCRLVVSQSQLDDEGYLYSAVGRSNLREQSPVHTTHRPPVGDDFACPSSLIGPVNK